MVGTSPRCIQRRRAYRRAMNNASILIMTSAADCWSCGAETEIITRIHIRLAEQTVQCSVSDLTAYPPLATDISDRLTGRRSIGLLKWRHSQTIGRQYISNGCVHCDALFGDSFEVLARNEEKPCLEFEPEDSSGWNKLAVALNESPDGHLFRA